MALTYEHKDGKSTLKVTGDVLDIAAEVLCMINRMYNVLHQDDPVIADIFKAILKSSVEEDGSPTWNIHEPNDDEVMQIVTFPPKAQSDEDGV